MDYSLLVGIHDKDRAEEEEEDAEEDAEENGLEEGEGEEGGHATGGSGNVPTPPDSPVAVSGTSPPLFTGMIDPAIEPFGMKCSESECFAVSYIISALNAEVAMVTSIAII